MQNKGIGIKFEYEFPNTKIWRTETSIFSHRNHNFENIRRNWIDCQLNLRFLESINIPYRLYRQRSCCFWLKKSEPVIRKSKIVENRWVNAEKAKELLYSEDGKIINEAEKMIFL